jgi:sensor histidine kinase regulating citrate/malate metabolism
LKKVPVRDFASYNNKQQNRKENKSLKTTKKDNIRHGHGVQSVRKVVEKYNGTVSFTDKGDIFEVSAMLYGIEVKE